MPFQVNIHTQVNSQSIRRESYNGRDHIVIPSHTLPGNVVMNGGLYPSSEIDKHYPKLEGTLAPLGHPSLDGVHVSAFRPESINANHIGAWNRNVKKAGQRVYLEKWVDIEVAKSSEGGRRFLERVAAIEAGEDVPPIHTSVAVFAERDPAPEGAGYEWIARILDMDHDAILLDEVGAATPEQGVGLMVNADAAKAVQVNSGALSGETFRDRERKLESAAREQFILPAETDKYLWLADFTDTQAVIVFNGGEAKVFGYKIENGAVIFDATGVPVERRESWVQKTAQYFANIFFNRPQMGIKQEVEAMPMTQEERAELGAMMRDTVGTALAPLTERLTAIEANHKTLHEAVTANARADEAKQREAVAAKFGKTVADALQGNALADMFRQCGEPAALAANSAAGGAGKQDFSNAAD